VPYMLQLYYQGLSLAEESMECRIVLDEAVFATVWSTWRAAEVTATATASHIVAAHCCCNWWGDGSCGGGGKKDCCVGVLKSCHIRLWGAGAVRLQP
jgi:hypothetical protein